MIELVFEIMINFFRDRWSQIKHIAIYHRLGLVPIKEISVCIAISSPHRQSSLEALPFALDNLKKSVPIWKKEHYEDDSGAWKANPECEWSEEAKKVIM